MQINKVSEMLYKISDLKNHNLNKHNLPWTAIGVEGEIIAGYMQ